MRLAIFHNHPSGGAARSFHELGRELARQHEITVYTMTTADETFLPSNEYARRVHTAFYAPSQSLRFGLHLNDARRYRDLDRLDAVSRRVAEQIDARGHDAVLVSACRFVQAPHVLNWLSTPSAYFCHEPPRRFVDGQSRAPSGPLSVYERARRLWHAPAARIVDRRLQSDDRRNVAAVDTLLTNSRYTLELVRGYYGRDAQACHLGVDAQRFVPASESESAKYVISVGAVERHKGFDFLVRAIALIPASERPPLLIIANTANPRVEQELRVLSGREGVDLEIVIGATEERLIASYQSARAFVYAPHGEPFGLSVLEAMACGKPIVAVAEGGVPETVVDGETGVLVERSEHAFAQALSRLLASPPQANAMGREGRRLVERCWTWADAAARIEDRLYAGAADAEFRREPPRAQGGGAQA